MTTPNSVASSENSAPNKMPPEASNTTPEDNNQKISPAERWLKIRTEALVRAQKRGFVGGNLYEDWLDAEKEIDSNFDTDFQGGFSLTDPAGINEQIKNIFAAYGLEDLSVEALLDKHREGMERLAAFNQSLIDSTSELANQQTALVQDALTEAVKTLQSVALGRMNTEGITKQAELSMKAVENALSHMKTFTEAITGVSTTSSAHTVKPKSEPPGK